MIAENTAVPNRAVAARPRGPTIVLKLLTFARSNYGHSADTKGNAPDGDPGRYSNTLKYF